MDGKYARMGAVIPDRHHHVVMYANTIRRNTKEKHSLKRNVGCLKLEATKSMIQILLYKYKLLLLLLVVVVIVVGGR